MTDPVVSSRVTGPELRLERRIAEVTVTALALEMGRPRKYVHDLERWAVVDKAAVDAYRSGVAALREDRT